MPLSKLDIKGNVLKDKTLEDEQMCDDKLRKLYAEQREPKTINGYRTVAVSSVGYVQHPDDRLQQLTRDPKYRPLPPSR